MRRHELEHLIRAAAAVTNEYEIVVIGSQSILGAVADPPAALLQSMEADCYPLKQPELADLIDGAIGELSPFHERFGYYAQGVGPETAVLPAGWQDRLVSGAARPGRCQAGGGTREGRAFRADHAAAWPDPAEHTA